MLGIGIAVQSFLPEFLQHLKGKITGIFFKFYVQVFTTRLLFADRLPPERE